MAFVYIAPLLDKTAFKIGKAVKPLARLIDLSRFYDFDFQDIHLIDCKKIHNAYKMEFTLHSACCNQQVIFESDGGTEFFAYPIYAKIMSIVTTLVDINGYSIEKMQPPTTTQLNEKTFENNELQVLFNGIGKNIRQKRLEYNITQDQLSKITGVAKATIKRIEGCGNGNMDNFFRILKALDLDYILSDLETDIPKRQRASKTSYMNAKVT